MNRCPCCGAEGDKPCRAQSFPGEVLPHASRPSTQATMMELEVPTAVDLPGRPLPMGPLSSVLPVVKNALGWGYVVVAGDSPAVIAEKVTGDRRRALELVRANPQQPRRGFSFRDLSLGEMLNLPEDWIIG